jgi:hypothetical protein
MPIGHAPGRRSAAGGGGAGAAVAASRIGGVRLIRFRLRDVRQLLASVVSQSSSGAMRTASSIINRSIA